MSHALISVEGVSEKGLKLETILETRKESLSDEAGDGAGGDGVEGGGAGFSGGLGTLAIWIEIGVVSGSEVRGTAAKVEIGVDVAIEEVTVGNAVGNPDGNPT